MPDAEETPHRTHWYDDRSWLKQFPWNTHEMQERVHELWLDFASHNDISPGSAFYRFLVWRLEGGGKKP